MCFSRWTVSTEETSKRGVGCDPFMGTFMGPPCVLGEVRSRHRRRRIGYYGLPDRVRDENKGQGHTFSSKYTVSVVVVSHSRRSFSSSGLSLYTRYSLWKSSDVN